jgi:hypothetical protein
VKVRQRLSFAAWVVRVADHVEFAAPDLLGHPNTYVLAAGIGSAMATPRR